MNSSSSGKVLINGIDVVMRIQQLYSRLGSDGSAAYSTTSTNAIGTSTPSIGWSGLDVVVLYDGPVLLNGINVLAAIADIEEIMMANDIQLPDTRFGSPALGFHRPFIGRNGEDFILNSSTTGVVRIGALDVVRWLEALSDAVR